MPTRMVTMATGESWLLYKCETCGSANRHTFAAVAKRGLVCLGCGHRGDRGLQKLDDRDATRELATRVA